MKLGVLLFWLVLAAVPPKPVKLLILGDSIAQAGDPAKEKPWRVWLKEIPGSKIRIEFVGLLPGFHGFAGKGVCWPDTMYGDPHGAACGAKTEDIHEWLLASLDYVDSTPPTDIVLATGTNNIGVGGQSVDTAIARLRRLALDCQKNFPKAKILLATVLRTKYYSVETYNDSVRALARELERKKMSVQLLDWTTAVALSDLHDGLHPGPEGSKKMAGYLLSVLEGRVSGVPIAVYPPHREPGAMDRIFNHGSHLSRRLRWRD